MAPIPGPSPSDIEDIRRKADDFARKAFADVLKRFEPLRKEIRESESEEAPAADEESA